MSDTRAKASDFQFSNPKINHFSFDINNSYKSEDTEGEIPVVFTIKRDPIDGNQQYEELNMKIGNEASPFTIDASIGAFFRWSNELDDDEVQDLLSKNAVSLLIGYLRPIVAQFTVQAGMRPLNLPFIDLS